MTSLKRISSRLLLVHLTIVALAGCAVSVDRIGGRIQPPAAPAIAWVDARPANAQPDKAVRTSMGMGERIPQTVFEQPPIEAFVAALSTELSREGVDLKGVKPVSIEALDIALVRGRAGAVDTGAARGSVAGGGPEALLGGLVAHLLIQMTEDRKAPNILSMDVVMRSGDRSLRCNDIAYWPAGSPVDPIWASLVQLTARKCAGAMQSPG